MRPVLRRIAGLAAPIVVGVVGALAGMTLWAKTTVSMGPFQVLLACRFGKGVTVIALPPFGRLTADTHFALLRFTATLQAVRINELTGITRSGGAERLVDQVQMDALHQVIPFEIGRAS